MLCLCLPGRLGLIDGRFLLFSQSGASGLVHIFHTHTNGRLKMRVGVVVDSTYLSWCWLHHLFGWLLYEHPAIGVSSRARRLLNHKEISHLLDRGQYLLPSSVSRLMFRNRQPNTISTPRDPAPSTSQQYKIVSNSPTPYSQTEYYSSST